MLSDLKKVQDKIEYLLQEYPETRDSDKLLWLAYNVRFNSLREVLTKEQYKIFKFWLMNTDTPMFESLSRSRRKIQELNPDLAGEKEKRLKEAESVKSWSL